jgi:hypothetical protein
MLDIFNLYDGVPFPTNMTTHVTAANAASWVASGEVTGYVDLGGGNYDFSNAMWQGHPIRINDYVPPKPPKSHEIEQP